MPNFVPLSAIPQPRRVEQLSPQAQYYEAFKNAWKQQEASRTQAVAFCPKAPYRLAVAHGTRVGLWTKDKDGSAEAAGSLNKFKDFTQCVAWRSDGRLLLVGEAGGTCAVVESETRKVLRRFRGHGDAVTCATFSTADKARAVTGCRDGRLRVWDVATSELVQTVEAHSDCMKVIASGSGGPDSWISAGYDGRVRLWDLRVPDGANAGAGARIVDSDHGHPVEAGVAYPGGAMFASAGGPVVKVWDLTSGGRVVNSVEAHTKVVTAVCLDSTASAFLTASFDGHAKIWNAADLQHLRTYRFGVPATCAAWRPDDLAFAVGFDDGQWRVRERPSEEALRSAAETKAAKRKRPLPTVGWSRGQDSVPDPEDEVVSRERPFKQRETKVDYFLRKFEYRKALQYMLLPSTEPEVGLAIVDELLQRGSLGTAMSEIGEKSCVDALRWLMKVFTNGDGFQQSLVEEALHTLLDYNRCLQPPCTPELVEAITRLENKVNNEMKNQEALMETSGMLKSILTV